MRLATVAAAPARRAKHPFVSGGGSQRTLLWASDWSTATGHTTNAVRDGTQWDTASNPNPLRMDVFENPGNLGFPEDMANILRLWARGDDGPGDGAAGLTIGQTGISEGWGEPGVGDHRYFRFYRRYALTTVDNDDMDMHFLLPAPNTGVYALQTSPPTAEGTFNNRYAIDFSPQDQWRAVPDLSTSETYRLEMHFHRTGTETLLFQGRIYNSDDSIYNETDELLCILNGHNHTGTPLTDYTMSGGATDFPGLRGFRLANEGGGGGWSGGDNDIMYYGGFAVSAEDWVGPYVAGERKVIS